MRGSQFSAAERDRAFSALRDAVLTGARSFGELYPIANRAVGRAAYDQSRSGAYRLTDRWLQLQRRAGHLTAVRSGTVYTWVVTDAGRAALEAGGAK